MGASKATIYINIAKIAVRLTGTVSPNYICLKMVSMDMTSGEDI